MELKDQLAVLVDLAESIGVTVRWTSRGRQSTDARAVVMVRLRGREMFFVDPAASIADQVSAIAALLADHPELGDRFICPQVRARLDEAREQG
jgi:hypothetical protein